MRANYKGDSDKNILIISGVHGDERTPLAITTKIIKDPKSFSQNYNELTVLHGINKPAIKENVRFVDDIDLNRAFTNEPEDADEHPLVSKIKKEIDRADIIIDIHSSRSCVELILVDRTEHAESFCDFASKHDIPCLIHKGNPTSIKRYCLSLGKPCFTVEVNKLGEVDPESAVNGYELVKKIVDNYSIEDFYPSENVPLETKSFFTKDDSVILPMVNKGDIIEPNQKIAIKIGRDGKSKYIVSNETEPKVVLVTNYLDYKTDPQILEFNKQKNITLFSIS